MALTTALPSASARAVETAAPSTRARPAQRHRPKFGVVGGSHRAVRLDQPVRLTRRGRLASRLGVAVSVAVIAFGMYQAVQPMAPEASSVRTVTVLPGQSLWTIGESANPGVDPRVSVGAIRDANGLGSTSLVRPGTELDVPVLASNS